MSPSSIVANPSAARRERGIRRRLLVAAMGLALLILSLIPAVGVGAQSVYPPNTVVSTYFDARYGVVSVVTDASGNLIDVNAATGQRIYPAFADTPAVYANGYLAPNYVAPNYVGPNALFGYGVLNTASGAYAVRQYTDTSSNCADGQVTQTASGFYCTTTGTPAFHVG